MEEVLPKCKYPMWALNRMKLKNNQQPSPGNNSSKNSDIQHNQTAPGCKKKETHMVVLYNQGLSESFKNVYGKHGVQVYRGGQTIKDLLVPPKDKDFITQKVG